MTKKYLALYLEQNLLLNEMQSFGHYLVAGKVYLILLLTHCNHSLVLPELTSCLHQFCTVMTSVEGYSCTCKFHSLKIFLPALLVACPVVPYLLERI